MAKKIVYNKIKIQDLSWPQNNDDCKKEKGRMWRFEHIIQ